MDSQAWSQPRVQEAAPHLPPEGAGFSRFKMPEESVSVNKSQMRLIRLINGEPGKPFTQRSPDT